MSSSENDSGPSDLNPDYIYVSSLPDDDLFDHPDKYTQAIVTHLNSAFTNDGSFDGRLHSVSGESQDIDEVVLYLPSPHLLQILTTIRDLIQEHGLNQPHFPTPVDLSSSPLVQMIQQTAKDLGIPQHEISQMGQQTIPQIIFGIVNETTIAALSRSAADRVPVIAVAQPIYSAFARALPKQTIAYLQFLTETDAVFSDTGYDPHVARFVSETLNSLDPALVRRIKATPGPNTPRAQLSMIEDYLREAKLYPGM